jgi:hypothetical protein
MKLNQNFFFSSIFLKETTTKEGEEDDEDKPKKPAATGGKAKKLTNQFNFSERASQTYNNPCRVFHSKKTRSSDY